MLTTDFLFAQLYRADIELEMNEAIEGHRISYHVNLDNLLSVIRRHPIHLLTEKQTITKASFQICNEKEKLPFG